MLWGAEKLMPAEYWCPYGNIGAMQLKCVLQVETLLHNAFKNRLVSIIFAMLVIFWYQDCGDRVDMVVSRQVQVATPEVIQTPPTELPTEPFTLLRHALAPKVRAEKTVNIKKVSWQNMIPKLSW